MGQYHLAMLPADEVAVGLVSAEDLDKVPFSKIFADVRPVKIADADTVQAGYVERRSCVGIPILRAQRRWRVPPIHYRGEKLGTESAPDADAAINSPLRSSQLRRLIRREGMFESIEKRAGSKHVSAPAVL